MHLDDITPEPATRTLLLAATGSGKSTVEAVIVEHYRRQNPTDRVYIIDPKRRFAATRRPRDAPFTTLFPDGYDARIVGKRNAVRVYAKLLRPQFGFNHEDLAFVVQDPDMINRLFAWLYNKADARRRVLVVLDESFDMMHGSASNPLLRRLYQQGREIGVGILTTNQRPRGIDRVWLTEAEYLIVGTLRHFEDLQYLDKNAAAPKGTFAAPLPKFVFRFIDQTGARPSHLFRMRLAKRKKGVG